MKKNKRKLGSDLAKVDAHVIQDSEYDELPELTDEMLEIGNFYVGGKLVKRGRPKSEIHANNISIRLDPKVESYFRAMGKGWQSRINSVLKEWVEKHPNA
ncbi:MAG: BrnA antitoxin family protein [Pseudomonadota bacterium]